MECFEILGISHTKDTKAIRKAYSSKLQFYPPETDPEGFQKLRAAYEEALKKAKQEDKEDSILTPVDEFMKRVEENYNIFEKRINTSVWKEMLESDICFNIDTGKEISERILTFLMDKYHFPYEVWSLFDSYFSWSTKKDKLYTKFPKNFIDFVVYKITTKDYFRYEYLLKSKQGLEEKFIAEYNKGCHAIEEYDLYTVKKAISEAEDICPEHPDLFLLKARYLITNGRLEEGKVILSELIEKEPEDMYAYLYRGNLSFRKGNFEDAYNDFKKVLHIKPDFIDALFSVGKCCISTEKYEEAIKHLTYLRDIIQYNREVRVLLATANLFYIDKLLESLNERSDDLTLKYKLAEAYLSVGKLEESYNVLSEIEQNAQITSEGYLLLCKTLLNMEKNELAYSTACKALELYPNDYDLIVYKACILDEFKRFEESIKFYDMALGIKKDDALVHNNKAYALNKLKRFNEGLESANKSIDIDPRMAHSYKNKADALLGLECFEEAFEACEDGLNIYAYLVEIYVIKMKLLARVGQFEEALNVYTRASDYGLVDSSLCTEKANVLKAYERYDESIIFCDQAIEMDDKNKEAYYCRGVCYFYKENYNEAMHSLEKAIEIDEKYEVAHYYNILSMLNLSRESEALTSLDKAIELNCENPDRFHKLKGDVLGNKENYNAAFIEYKKALEVNPSIAKYHYLAGSALNNDKRYKESVPYLNKAIEIDPTLLDAYIDKSHSLYFLGEYKKCLEQCDIALDINPDYLLAHQNKAWALYKLGDLSEAEKYCNSGLKIDSNYLNLLGLKLNLLRERNAIKDALIVTDRILEISPDDEHALAVREELNKASKPKKGLFDSLFGQR